MIWVAYLLTLLGEAMELPSYVMCIGAGNRNKIENKCTCKTSASRIEIFID